MDAASVQNGLDETIDVTPIGTVGPTGSRFPVFSFQRRRYTPTVSRTKKHSSLFFLPEK